MIIKKSQKPIEIDVSLKYICPNINCGFEHWLFLRQAKTKNFKIVCECGTIFKPKRIQNIEIVYPHKESVKKPVDSPEASGKIEEYPEFVSHAINMMVSLGYSKKDSQDNIVLIYNKENVTDPATLVRKAISYLGGI